MILSILGVVFFCLCLYAAGHDFSCLKIPNWLNLAIAALFIPAAGVSGLPLEMVGGHVIAGVVAFVLGYGLFAFGIIGGGDAKMLPGVLLWLGPDAALPFLFYMAMAGGVLTLCLIIARKAVPVEIVPGKIRASFEEKAGVPYGVAIAAGAFAAAASSPLLVELVNQIGSIG